MGGMLEERAASAALTRREKLALDYILKNKRTCCLMTSGEIADQLSIGASTVVRLSGRLGFESFAAMRKELQREVVGRPAAGEGEPIPYEKMRDYGHLSEEELLSVFSRKVQSHIQSDAGEETGRRLMDAAARIGAARRVYVAGFRSCAGFASFFATLLSALRPDVVLLGQYPSLADQLADMAGEDVLVALSFSRYSKSALFTAQAAREAGCPVIAMTDSYVSPIAEGAALTVIHSVENFTYFNSYASLAVNLEKIALLVSHKSRDRAEERLKKLEGLLSRTGGY